MSGSEEMNLGRETAGAMIAHIVMALAGFVGTIIFARILGPTSFGGVYLLLALTKIADRPMSGWASAMKKRVSEDITQTGIALGSQFLFNAAWILTLGCAIFLVDEQLIAYTGLTNAAVLFILLLLTASTYETLGRLVQAHGRISAETWVDTVRSYLTLPLQLGFILVGLGASGMVYGLAGASALSLFIILFLLATPPQLPSRDRLEDYWAYARYSIPMVSLGTIYDRFDVVLLGLIVTPAAAGYYEVAWKLTLPAMFLSQSASQGLMAKVSALDVRKQSVVDDIRNTTSFSSLLALPLFVGAVVLGDDLVRTVYGMDYVTATPFLFGLAAFRIVRTQSGPLLNAVNGLDRPDVTMRLAGAAVLVNVLLGVGLVVAIGSIGIVIATFIAECVRYIGAVRFFRSELSEYTALTRPFVEQAIAALVMGIVLVPFHRNISVSSWVDLGLLVGIGGTTYCIGLLGLSAQFRATTRDILTDIVADFSNTF